MNDVVEVRPLGGYRVYLRFEDGTAGELDLTSVISSFDGVFAPLEDETEFAKVRVDPDAGTIVWYFWLLQVLPHFLGRHIPIVSHKPCPRRC